MRFGLTPRLWRAAVGGAIRPRGVPTRLERGTSLPPRFLLGPCLVLGVLACAPLARFEPISPAIPFAGAWETADTIALSGRVLAVVGGVRYRGRCAMVGCRDHMRLQVFGSDGALLADIGVAHETLTVVTPGPGCHRGTLATVPLDSLLGIPVPWGPALPLIQSVLWPRRIGGPLVYGRVGRRRGWYAEELGLFLEVDGSSPRPRSLVSLAPGGRVELRVEEWGRIPAGEVPSRLRVVWPAQETTLWLSLSVRMWEGFDRAAMRVDCPPRTPARVW